MSTVGDISPAMVGRKNIVVALPNATIKGRLEKYALQDCGMFADAVILTLGGITLPPLPQRTPCLIRGIDD